MRDDDKALSELSGLTTFQVFWIRGILGAIRVQMLAKD